MPQTTWRPYPFVAEAVAEPAIKAKQASKPKALSAEEKAAKVAALVKRKGGVVTRKEVARCLNYSDGTHLDAIMRRANVGMVGTYKNASGTATKLYGFKP